MGEFTNRLPSVNSFMHVSVVLLFQTFQDSIITHRSNRSACAHSLFLILLYESSIFQFSLAISLPFMASNVTQNPMSHPGMHEQMAHRGHLAISYRRDSASVTLIFFDLVHESPIQPPNTNFSGLGQSQSWA